MKRSKERVQLIQLKAILSAYNTDVIGLEETIAPILNEKENIKALILGSGGSANSVAYVLQILGIYFSIVSRKYRQSSSSALKRSSLLSYFRKRTGNLS